MTNVMEMDPEVAAVLASYRAGRPPDLIDIGYGTKLHWGLKQTEELVSMMIYVREARRFLLAHFKETPTVADTEEAPAKPARNPARSVTIVRKPKDPATG